MATKVSEKKEIVEVEKQVNPLQIAVQEMTIKTTDDYEIAVTLGGQIKTAQKFVTGKKEAITKPMNDALKNVRDMFRPFENVLDTAESMLKSKMLDFKREEDRKKAQIEARVEKGTMKTETAVAKVQEMTQKTVRTETGAKATETFRIEYVITDATQIPREFLVPDMQAIKQAFKEGKAVAGVEAKKVPTMSF